MFIDDTKLIQVNNGADLAIDAVTLSGPVGDLILQGPSGVISVPSILHAAGGGVFSGTWTGAPTLSWTPTWSGHQNFSAGADIAGGALSSTFTGDWSFAGNVAGTGTGAFGVPVGTTGQQPNAGLTGQVRYNTTTGRYEFGTGSAWKNHVRLDGDTMTGALTTTGMTVNGGHTVTGNTSLQSTTTIGTNTLASNFTANINGAAATARGLTWQTAGSNRWRVGVDVASESGGNAGASFNVSRFSDAGSLIDTPFTLSRASGLGQFNSGLTVLGTHTVGSSSTAFSTTSPMLTTATNLTGALTTGSINNNYGVWLLNLNSDAVDAGSGKSIAGIYSYMQWGTSSSGGSRTGLCSIIKHTATSGNKAKSYASPFYVASAGSASSALNDGGTSLAQYSAIFGGNFVSTLQTGATYWRECSAVEFNVAIETGASANRKNGVKIVKLSDDATQALDLSQDTALNVADQSGVAVGWQQGIGVGDRYAQWPMAATGALFRAFLSSNNSTNPSTVGYGIDALEADIATYAFRSRGYNVSGGSATGAIVQNGPAQIAGTSTGLTIDTNVAVATAIAVSSGGTGYVNGEVFYFGNGGIGKVVAQTGGVVTSVSLYREPFDTSGTPPATLSVTSSWQPLGSAALSGSGLVLSVTWNTTATTLKLQPTAGGSIQTGSGTWSANGSVATALSSVGPTGSHTTVQEWFTVKNASGTVRYIPAF